MSILSDEHAPSTRHNKALIARRMPMLRMSAAVILCGRSGIAHNPADRA
jgi:hypothetical protein